MDTEAREERKHVRTRWRLEAHYACADRRGARCSLCHFAAPQHAVLAEVPHEQWWQWQPPGKDEAVATAVCMYVCVCV